MDKEQKECFLTTKDNSVDPFTNFKSWINHDRMLGYNTCGLIDKFAKTSDLFSESMNKKIVDEAYKRIVELDATGKYVVVTPNDYKNGILVRKFD